MSQAQHGPSIDWDRVETLRRAGPVPESGLLSPDRVIGRSGRCTVVYGPFDAPAFPAAKVILVGLTPGYAQLRLANAALADALAAGITDPTAVAAMRRERAAFAGTMRTNLISMLDRIGLAGSLGIESTRELFASGSALLAATSALRYPVFVGSEMKNYGGSKTMMEHHLFREMVERLLRSDLEAAPEALAIPLGDASQGALKWLSERGVIDEARILRGFPHPSGGNGHRVRRFAENETSLREQIEAWFLHD